MTLDENSGFRPTNNLAFWTAKIKVDHQSPIVNYGWINLFNFKVIDSWAKFDGYRNKNIHRFTIGELYELEVYADSKSSIPFSDDPAISFVRSDSIRGSFYTEPPKKDRNLPNIILGALLALGIGVLFESFFNRTSKSTQNKST